jgi:hypothetical protein
MEHIHQVFALLLFALATLLCWRAFQINFNGRTDLVRLGNRQLPSASKLESQFALIEFLQSATFAVAGGAILLLESLQPTVLILLGVTTLLSVRRFLLVRSLERYAGSEGGKQGRAE